jgi:putative spermidine/putrescine transport system ATP-binding protein
VNEFVAGFVGTSNILERDGQRFTVRPEKVRILSAADADKHDAEPVPSGLHVESGTVTEIVYLGSVTRYVVKLDRGETLVALRQNLEPATAGQPEERGRRVQLAWGPQHINAVDVEGAPAQQYKEEVPQ